MTIPAGGPATLAAVKQLLNIDSGDTSEDARLTPKVAAVNAVVRDWPCSAKADGAADWNGEDLANVVEGANLLAARLYRRKNSVDGVQVLGSNVLSAALDDPDIVMLLQLLKPAIG